MALRSDDILHKIVFLLFWVTFSIQGFSQCAGIDFTASQTTVCAPELVRFYSQNIPAGSTITWDYGFGDNLGKDTGQNIYTAPGVHTIVLKVTLSDGVTVCTVSKSNYITVIPKPTPSFTVSRKVLCNGPDTVTITDNSVGGTGRDWVIDGLPLADTSKTIVHGFNSTGYKSILMVLKSASCADAFYKEDSAIIVYDSLTIDFIADNTVGCAPATINFTPTINTAGHTITNYNWTFTGGSPATSSAVSPSIVYNTSGSYNVGLTVTNSDGCTQTVNKPGYLQMGDTINFSIVPSKTSICRSEIISLDISDPTLQGTFTWDLGNGVPQAGSTPKQQLVQFNDTGFQAYKVTREYNGCKTVRTYTKGVFVRTPLAGFTILNEVECDSAAKIFVFNTSKLDPTATHSYRWNLFGPNGSLINTSTDSIPNFSTNGFGQYGLQLIVTSSASCDDSLYSDEIFRRTGVGNFIVRPEASCPGGTVNFVSTSAAFSTAEPNIYQWTIYDTDGTTVLHSQNTGIIPQISYSFNAAGTYSANLIVYNSKCRDTVKVNKTVDIVSPTTNINASDVLPCVKTPINLSASTTPNIAAPGYTYDWVLTNSADTSIKFVGDGSSINVLPDTPGVYNLLTVVKWGQGCVDSIKNTDYVRVSGPIISIALDNYNDCLPFSTNATSNLFINHNYKNTANNNITYSWSSIPPGPIFSNPNAANTQISTNTNGEYRIRLIAENGSGCRDTIDEQTTINAGVVSSYSISTTTACVFGEINIGPQSLYKPDRYQWFSTPPGAIFTPSADVDNPIITFPDSGMYTISQVASKRNTCFDTATTSIKIVKTVANFTSDDTLNYCAPVNVKFRSSSINADNLIWEFGDGKKLTTSNVDSLVYIYFTNSVPPGFNVKLKAVNNIGCADSITRFGYVRIDGPVPDFMINISKGCEPLTVDIVDNSISYSEYYFDYGDGSAFDTTGNPGTHIYTTDNTTDEISRFRPSLYLIDPLGCFSERKYPFDIEVYKLPNIKFVADTLQGCVPLTINFTDSSRFVQEYQWDMDGNGFVNDTAKNPIHTYTTPGLKTVILRARSQYGCVQYDTTIDYINVYDLPTADFTFSKIDTDTAYIYYDLTNQSLNYNTLEWFIDSVSVSTQNMFRHGFKDTGATNIKLLAISLEGCIDSVDTLIRVIPDFFFHIPNAFTPNKEGVNEKFGPTAPPWARRYVMRIYNRYGQMLFETDQTSEQWDGTFNEYPVQDGVYVYSIEYLDIEGRSHVYQGTFLLFR
jgi:gliding motility-associated-like protein